MKKITFFFFLLTSGLAMSEGNFSKTQKDLESRLTKVIKSYDERAYVLVDFKIKDKKVDLPSTPFVFQDYAIENEKFLKLDSLKITIVSRLTEVPEEIKNLIENITKNYGVKPTIEMVTVKSSVSSGSIMSMSLAEILTSFGILVGIALFAFFIMSQKKNNKVALDVLENQLGKLSSSMENMSGSRGQASESESKGSSNSSIEISTSSASVWESLEFKSIKAILSDCYWCLEDNYAAFIWGKISIETRKKVLDENILSHKYVNYLSSIEPLDLGLVNDPYYLAPLDIDHISNEDMTELVRENPSMMKSISKMRSTHLPLKASELLKITENDEGEFNTDTLKSVESSKERVIKSKEVFFFSSIEEESEIINMPDLDIDTMRKFPSLAWITKLTEEEGKDILGAYTARQLAGVWIAPEDILAKLEGLIPGKKMELLKSYLDKVVPDRKNNIYTEIINASLEILDEQGSSHIKEVA